MKDLSRKALAGLARFILILGLILFLTAWSLRFWQAWIYWGICSAMLIAVTLYFLKHDPRLIERRMAVGAGAEPRKSQKRIQAVTGTLAGILIFIPGFDFRMHWSAVPVPAPLVLLADLLVALGYGMIFFVFRENTFTAGVVTVEEGQHVVTTGPYAIVRHPMYAAAALQFLATPLALGSWWALLAAVPLTGMLAVRIIDEERLLRESLPGYREYCQKVRYRLIPELW
jgi:protein-S-isoprenylcysteine O-methyltransferase Ste14